MSAELGLLPPAAELSPEALCGITVGLTHALGRVLNLRGPPVTRLLFPC